ncbi:hypothetical protein EW026_g4383 [Hermanssonia centrifuga]|uniref:Aminoacyl-transfer RNA synthetases class-II family profile domain-containing protein n=1 Tax=Hermanssonia centrifuga TaxID=98765 RepID=A0A4S4KHB2_9APHY|nr:hypothetical protein EW026_g4383 [Hermanssonia centrifuga]
MQTFPSRQPTQGTCDPHQPHEDLRLRYRYLDLRRPVLSNNLHKRSKVAHIVRSTLHDNDFVEVETPILLKSTPEGAREFLVPTRLSSTANARSSSHPLFYALPQSPQQPKQLLIASGAVDRYYQIARCFRDEDGRKDRQPEFTQIDLEMAWVSWGNQYAADAGVWRIGGKEVKEVIETLIRRIWSTIEGVELPEEFRVMTYAEAMNRFGSDKPDVRFGLEARLSQTDDIVEALVDAPRQQYSLSGSAGLLSDYDVQRAVANAIELQKGDTIWVAKRSRIPQGGSTTLGRLRLSLSAIAQSLGTLSLPTDPHFLWVTEFPLFTRADSDKDFLTRGRWGSSHHPFTAPMWEDIEKMYSGQVYEVRGQHYDLVLNGTEIGGGSVRVHDANMQEYIFSEILQLSNSERSSFDHLLHALRCGAPPHGGIALGFDRLMAILCKAESIRDVIAFPKTGAGTDLLFRSPAPASSPDILQQYGIEQQRS